MRLIGYLDRQSVVGEMHPFRQCPFLGRMTAHLVGNMGQVGGTGRHPITDMQRFVQREMRQVMFFSQGVDNQRIHSFDLFETAFLLRIMSLAADLSQTVTFGQASKLFGTYSDESFVAFYLSKKWDILRSFGLLQV